MHGVAELGGAAAEGGRLGGAVAGLDERAVDAVAVAEHFERRRLEEEAPAAAAAGAGEPAGLASPVRRARLIRRRQWRRVVGVHVVLLLGHVERLVDERQPPRCRLVVLQD